MGIQVFTPDQLEELSIKKFEGKYLLGAWMRNGCRMDIRLFDTLEAAQQGLKSIFKKKKPVDSECLVQDSP